MYLKPIHGLFSIKNTIFTGKLPQFLGQKKKNPQYPKKKKKQAKQRKETQKNQNQDKITRVNNDLLSYHTTKIYKKKLQTPLPERERDAGAIVYGAYAVQGAG